ncbi:MAG: hypothetical protein L0K95_13345 [Tetragenococcus koreensis]|nr:hypothetical protein [Atopostipes sp.]MDN6580733.1 hypothetical protein [Tetragenococcus koreensis]
MRGLCKVNPDDYKQKISRYLDVEEMKTAFDPLTQKDMGGEHDANLGWGGQDFTHSYTEGFYKGAVKILENSGSADMDYVVYPIIFSYRHYIELSLKNLDLMLELYFEERIKIKNTHDICSLLCSVVETLYDKKIMFILPDEIQDVILNIACLDERNDRFRYAYSQCGKLSHEYDSVQYNLDKIYKAMKQVHEYFEFIFRWFEDRGVKETSLPYFHFRNFIQLVGALKNKDELNVNGKLGKISYSFGETIIINGAFSQKNEEQEIVRKLFIDRESISKNNDIVKCKVMFDNEGAVNNIAEIEFFLTGKKSKIKDFKVTSF